MGNSFHEHKEAWEAKKQNKEGRQERKERERERARRKKEKTSALRLVPLFRKRKEQKFGNSQIIFASSHVKLYAKMSFQK